jgi:hypothetical protein
MSEKAKLVKALKQKGIPIPKDSKVAELRHRNEHWLTGVGWLLRLAKPSSRKPQSPATLLPDKNTYWLPDSRMAHDIVKTKLVFVMGRSALPPNGTNIIDVPKDYNNRWPVKQPIGEEE